MIKLTYGGRPKLTVNSRGLTNLGAKEPRQLVQQSDSGVWGSMTQPSVAPTQTPTDNVSGVGNVGVSPTLKTPSGAAQTSNRRASVLPSTDNAESFVKGLNAASEYQQSYTDNSATQRLAADMAKMAEASTKRNNLKTGMRFRSLADPVSIDNGVKPTAQDEAWYKTMTNAEKRHAYKITDAEELGQYINSLDLNARAVQQRNDALAKTAKELEVKQLRKTESVTGQAIAAQIESGLEAPRYSYAAQHLDEYTGGFYSELRFLTDRQRETIQKFAKAGDYQAIEDYYNAIKGTLNQGEQKELETNYKQFGKEHPVLSVVPEGVLNSANGIPVMAEAVYNKVRESFTGEWTPVDYNSHVYDMVAASQAIQEGATERIMGTVDPNTGQRVGGIQNEQLRGLANTARQGTSSAITNGVQLLTGAALGLNGAALSNFTIGVMGSSAAGQQYRRELKEGKSQDVALANAFATGIIESLTEKVSVDRFIKQAPMLTGKNGKELLASWLKMSAVQGGIEGLEEITGNVADQLWDIYFEGQNSEYSKRTQAILAAKIGEGINRTGNQDYSPTDDEINAARQQAFTELFVQQSAEAFASAVFSSFLLAGAPAAYNGINNVLGGQRLINYGNQHKTTIGGVERNATVLNEIEKGKLTGQQNVLVAKQAQEVAEELDNAYQKDKKVSPAMLGHLARLNNLALFETVEKMADSANEQVRNYAFDILARQDEWTNEKILYGSWETFYKVANSNSIDPLSHPFASQESREATAQSLRTQAENPDSRVLTATEQAVKNAFPRLELETIERRANIIDRLAAGENVSMGEFETIEPDDIGTKNLFQTLTGVSIPDGLSNDALYQAYQRVSKPVAEAVLDAEGQNLRQEEAEREQKEQSQPISAVPEAAPVSPQAQILQQQDELLPAAMDVVLETGQASVSMLQRQLNLGYSRAANLIDEMERSGYVGPFEGSRPRQILISREQWQDLRGDSGQTQAAEAAPATQDENQGKRGVTRAPDNTPINFHWAVVPSVSPDSQSLDVSLAMDNPDGRNPTLTESVESRETGEKALADNVKFDAEAEAYFNEESKYGDNGGSVGAAALNLLQGTVYERLNQLIEQRGELDYQPAKFVLIHDNETGQDYRAPFEIVRNEETGKDEVVLKYVSAPKGIQENIVHQMNAPGISSYRFGIYDYGIVKGWFDKNPISTKALLTKTESRLKSEGFNALYGEMQRKIAEFKPFQPEDLAMAQTLLVNMSQARNINHKEYIEFAAQISNLMSAFGQSLRMAQLLDQIDPNWEVINAVKQVETMNQKAEEKGRRRNPDQRKTRETAETVVEESREEVLDEMMDPEKAKNNSKRRQAKRGRRKRSGKQNKTGNRLHPTGNIVGVEGQERLEDFPDTFKSRHKSNHGFPVPYWMQDAGEIIAEALNKNATEAAPKTPKERRVVQTVMQDLLKFTEGYAVPKAQRSANQNNPAVERLRNYLMNREKYHEAWKSAQDSLRSQYERDGDTEKLEAFETFLNGRLDLTEPNAKNPLEQAVMSVILKSDNQIRPKDISMRVFLKDTDSVIETLYQNIIQQIQPQLETFRDSEGTEQHFSISETDKTEIRRAVSKYVFDTFYEDNKLVGRINAGINATMRDIGIKMADVIRQGNSNKGATAQIVADILIQQYGISEDAAQRASEIVIYSFNNQVAERSEETLRRMFDEKKLPAKSQKELDRIFKKFSDLANMGAFTEENYREKAAERIFGFKSIKIDDALIEQFRNATNEEERQQAREAIQQNVADQMPANIWEKFANFRYTSMLFSPKTWGRNFLANIPIIPTVAAKEAVAERLEILSAKLGNENVQRTRSFRYRAEDRRAAAAEFPKFRQIIMNGGMFADAMGRTSNDFMRGVQEKRRIFNNRLLERMRRFTIDVMDGGDAVFAEWTYSRSMARWLYANNLTYKQAEEQGRLDDARAHAVREAAEATYRDYNAFATAITTLGYRGQNLNAIESGANIIIGGVMPFKRTPANVVVRAVEYSPIGFVTTAFQDAQRRFGANNMTGNDIINNLSKAISGSAMWFLLGMFLRSHDWLTGKGPDDDEEKNFLKLQGWQPYSFHIKVGKFDRYFSVDFLAPLALTMFMGANFMESLGDGFQFSDVSETVTGIFDPLMNMSFMQGINDVFEEAGKFGSGPYAIMNFATTALWNYLTQGIPSLVGQFERASNNTRMTTYIDKDPEHDPLSSNRQYTIGQLSGRIPGWDYQQIPYIDAWGRIGKNYESPAFNAIAQIASPGYQSIAKRSVMEDEIQRLYDELKAADRIEKSILPKRPQNNFTVKSGDSTVDKYLTAEEFASDVMGKGYALTRGGTAYDIMNALIDPDGKSAYWSLDADKRVEAIKWVYDYSNQYAKALVTGYEPINWDSDPKDGQFNPDSSMKKAFLYAHNGGSLADFAVAYAVQKSVGDNIKDGNGKDITVDIKKPNEKNELKTVGKPGSSSLEKALLIRQSLDLTEQQYKELYGAFNIAESVRGLSETSMQNKLAQIQRKGGVAP